MASEIRQQRFASPILGRDYDYLAYLPPLYEAQTQNHYPVIYLLHGRGGSMQDWKNAQATLDLLISSEAVPPLIAIMPDMPSSTRASYYVDSLYSGRMRPDQLLQPGEAVETAFVQDLIPHIDSIYRTLTQRKGRLIGGVSMGGYGALRYALAYPYLFSGCISIAPAVYTPLPPIESTTRGFGAFGVGDLLFDEGRYQALNYPALLEAFPSTGYDLNLFIGVGDGEWMHVDPVEQLYDLDMQAHLVYNRARRVEEIRAALRIFGGGHNWEVWRKLFAEGLVYTLSE